MFELPPAPRMSGTVLRSVVAATAAEPVRRAIVALMRKDLGIEAARALPTACREELPLHSRPVRARDRYDRPSAELALPESSAHLPNAAAWQARYRDGLSPVEVVERLFVEARRLASASPSMAVLCTPDEARAREDAEASAKRFAAGAPLGPLDGIPVPIKEEVDIEGIGYRLGTSFVPPSKASGDSTVVAALRAAGALIVGHTPMTEMGMSPLGANPHRDMPRNAHAADRAPGGSSSGARPRLAPGGRLRRHDGPPGPARRQRARPRGLPRGGRQP